MEKSTRYTIILLAILAALLLFLPKNQGPDFYSAPSPPAASISLSPNPPRANQTLELVLTLPPQCVYSPTQLKADNPTIMDAKANNSLVTSTLRLSTGPHIISYSDGNLCSAVLVTNVLAALCNSGTSRACKDSSGCAGTQQCAGGVWLACRTPPRVCSPNTKVPCPLDNCRWGTATCNSCGSAWSVCK